MSAEHLEFIFAGRRFARKHDVWFHDGSGTLPDCRAEVQPHEAAMLNRIAETSGLVVAAAASKEEPHHD